MFMRMKYLLVALLALCGVAAATAGAASATVVHDFEAEKTPYILTGKATGAQTVMQWSGGAAMTCTASSFNGTIKSSPTAELTLEPVYEGCSINSLPVTIDTPCKSLFTGETTALGHGTVHIECEAEPVRLTVNGCTVEFGAQTPEQGAHYTNTGAGTTRDVDLQVTETKTKYSLVNAACSLIVGLTGEFSIVGSYTMRAYEDKSGTEGAQIGFWFKSTVF